MSDQKENPFSPKNIAETDQSVAWLIDNLPLLWHGLYTGCLARGFSDGHAMFLVSTYITAMYTRK